VSGAAGGALQFLDDSSGGSARVKVFGAGNLDLNSHNPPGVTVGSIQGTGVVFLGANNLTVSSDNAGTLFAGVIQDGGIGGSFTKAGSGMLTLSGQNTYTGGTTVEDGTLLVKNNGGSGTGTGAVTVNGGIFGGTGKISGAVTIASGTTPAILVAGSGTRPGTLTTLSTLAFNAHATYKIDLNSTTVTADKVTAKGVTITSGALVSIGDLRGGILTASTIFTVINNTAPTPIAGTFSNLADGSTLTVGNNTYKANYEGGTGNDLTLTVQ
jgi:autotransporter-associated beta strand protein